MIDVDRHAVLDMRTTDGRMDIGYEAGEYRDTSVRFVGEGVTRLSHGIITSGSGNSGYVSVQKGYVHAPVIGWKKSEVSRVTMTEGTLVTDEIGAEVVAYGGSVICTNFSSATAPHRGDDPVYRVTAGGLTAEYEPGHDGELAYQNPILVTGLPDNYYVRSIFPVDGEVCFLLPDGTYDFWVGQRHYTATVNGADVTAVADGASPWTYVKEGDYVTITGCIAPPQDLVVPAELGGGQVWKLADNLFADCTNIRTVTLPNTVEQIGDAVFCGCSNIVSITGLGGVRSFGVSTFEGCASLTTLTIPYVYEIPDQCFLGCSSLTNITIPSGCKRIGMAAFASCAFDELTVPEGVTNIGHYAFLNGSINAVRLPSTIASIGTGAFADVTGLTNVFINAMQAPATGANPFAGVSDTATLQVPAGSRGWDGDPESSALPERWNGLLVVAYVPAYNTPEGAVAIGGAERSESVINNGAAADPADPVAEFTEDDLASSVWFRWTAPSTGLVTFQTETLTENLDTVMSISRGAPGDFTTVAYNDDADGETLMSKATFACTAGTDYYICVATKDAGSPWGEIWLGWEVSDAAPVAATGAFVNGLSVGDNLGGDGWIFTDGLVHIQLNRDFAHALELTVTGYDSTNQILKASGKLWYHLTAGLRGTIDFWASADDFRDMKLTVYKGTNESELVEVPLGTEYYYWAQIKVDSGDAYYAVVESAEPGEEVGISFTWNYTEPTGFENWAYENGLTGDDAAMDAKPAKWGGKRANAFIYAFGEDIVSGKNPLMQISFDAELKPVITLAPQINGFSEFVIEVRGLTDLNDDWESDFIMLEQTGARTWEVPAAKEGEPAPEPHFFRIVIF